MTRHQAWRLGGIPSVAIIRRTGYLPKELNAKAKTTLAYWNLQRCFAVSSLAGLFERRAVFIRRLRQARINAWSRPCSPPVWVPLQARLSIKEVAQKDLINMWSTLFLGRPSLWDPVTVVTPWVLETRSVEISTPKQRGRWEANQRAIATPCLSLMSTIPL